MPTPALIVDGRIAPGASRSSSGPGSHTKLVEVDAEGRIARSHTTLAGEMLQAVAQHTLVAASLPAALPDELDTDAAAAGARAAVRYGLGRAAFLVRIAALTGTLDEQGPRIVLDRRRRRPPTSTAWPATRSSSRAGRCSSAGASRCARSTRSGWPGAMRGPVVALESIDWPMPPRL